MNGIRCVLLALLVAGCSHAGVRFDSGTHAATGLNVRFGSTAAELITLGIVAAAVYESERDHRHMHVAPLDENRRIHEQDCTRPVENWSANLRCR